MLAPMLRRSVALAFRQGNLAAFTPLITSVRSFSTHKSPEDYPDLAGHEDHEHWTLEKELSKGDHYYVDDRRQMTRMSKNDERIDPTSHPASRYRMVPLWMAHESTLYERDPPEKSAAQTKKKSAIKRWHLIKYPMRDEKGRAYGTGRRKTAVARVWVSEGTGQIFVNKKNFVDYFPIPEHRHHCLEPMLLTRTVGAFDIYTTVKGGGVSGQAGAIRHGISTALSRYDPYLRPILKQGGMLRRDPRMVERKKPGKRKARRSFQWVKR